MNTLAGYGKTSAQPATSSRDANSPIMTVGAFVLAEGIVGMTEASPTCRPSTPRTRSSASLQVLTTLERPDHPSALAARAPRRCGMGAHQRFCADGLGKAMLTWAPALTVTCCVWVTSCPLSFQRAWTS